MEDLWGRLLEWCSAKFEEIMMWGGDMVVEKAPEALAEMSLYRAVPAWLMLSVVWVVPIGLATLVAEALLFPFATYEAFFAGDDSHKPYQVAVYLPMMGLMAFFLFIAYRFMAPVVMFKSGVLDPRRKVNCILAA